MKILKICLINLVVAVFIVATLMFGAYLWLNNYTRHGNEVEIPDIKGISVDKITSFFAEKELNYVVTDSIPSKNEKPGTIIETFPPIGSRVKKGRTVQLKISSYTAKLVEVPNVNDTSQRHAVAVLKSYGFEQVDVKSVPGVYRDLVVGLESRGRSLMHGEKISSGTPVTILVSSGSEEFTYTEDTSVVPLELPEENWF